MAWRLSLVAQVRFSRRAEEDLLSIGSYTLRTWGEAQADRYLHELEACCERLGENPFLGRGCGQIRPGLRRMEHGKHVIFYRRLDDGVLVLRILHERMLPGFRAIDDTLPPGE